jgi:hypothetical protein
MACIMNNKFYGFLAVLLISSLTSFLDIKSAFSQGRNGDSDNLIYLGDNQNRESVFIDRDSVKQWASSEEHFFTIFWESRNLYYFIEYRGSCASAAVKPLRTTVQDIIGETKFRENYTKGWEYPVKGSIARNALSKACKILYR